LTISLKQICARKLGKTPNSGIFVYVTHQPTPSNQCHDAEVVHREGIGFMQAWIAGMDENQVPDEGI
jgi:hypothetical protein